jgi:MFS transporter, Spinster family, sphingosine-1-phosphate transporter
VSGTTVESPLNTLALDRPNDYLFGRREATIAFVLTVALMVLDYATRQIIVSVFPYLKTLWSLSDTQLGALVSVVSVTVAVAGIPVALVADRWSRVKSIAVMGLIWSVATVACMAARGYGELLAARALVGLGEAGYGSVGCALVATHFPVRLRGTVLAAFFAAASVGSVLGVMLGGVVAVRWGWRAPFGVVGIPCVLLALLFLRVRDYPTVPISPSARSGSARPGSASALASRLTASLATPTLRWVCLGAAAQLIVVSAVWSWLPSFFVRYHGMAPDRAAVRAALVVLLGALGSLVWGRVVDRTSGAQQTRRRLYLVAALCTLSALCAATAFAITRLGEPALQSGLIALAGFMLTCTVGPVSAVVIEIVHPSIRSTGASMLSLFQNLFGLASGPFIAGMLSDRLGLSTSLTCVPAFACVAAILFILAGRSHDAGLARAREPLGHTA